jgi:two-component system KDP operon response regulator KdpE
MTVLRRVREWSQVPVIVLTACGQEDSKVAAFAAGADDYLTKPCGVPETLARIAVALRHACALKDAGGEESARFQTGELLVDLANRSVTVRGTLVHLSPIEYDLLATFAKNAGKLLTHQYLLHEIWNLACLDKVHYLHIYIGNLRKKIEDDPAEPQYLLTEQGVGYRLVDAEPWDPSRGQEAGADKAGPPPPR